MTPLSALMHIREILQDTTIPDPRTVQERIGAIVDKVLDDPETEVMRHATTNPRPKGVVPHHVRCSSMLNGARCTRVDPHTGPHEF